MATEIRKPGIKYTLITGASEGIGKAMAVECAKRKQNLILVSLPHSDLEEYARQLRQDYQVEVKVHEFNLTDTGSIQELFDWCQQEDLAINVLINNAGIGNYTPFLTSQLSKYQDIIKLNIESVVTLTKLFIPKLRANKESYILNVGSFAALMPLPYKSVYAASKSFVLSFSRSLEMELKPYNIHVSCLCPGPTRTQTMNDRNQDIEGSADILSKSAGEVAKEAIDGLFKKQGLIIPGWKNRALIKLGQFLPFSLKSFILRKIFKDGANNGGNEEAGSE